MTNKRGHDDKTASPRPFKSSKKSQFQSRRTELDAKYPETVQRVRVSSCQNSTSLVCQRDLPPLPPIQAGHLSEAPFTHSSTVDAKYSATNQLTYERLEFLGDAYLEVIATRQIYTRCPHLLTGRQAQLRETMIRNSTLANFARQYNFQERIRVHSKEMDSHRWEKILADVFEAYVAAVVLSNPADGFDIAEDWLTELWTDILLQHDAKTSGVDYKTQLAAKISYHTVKLTYEEEEPMREVQGVQHNIMGVYFTGWGYEHIRIGRAEGCGKKEAGLLAAKDALENNQSLLEDIAEKKRSHLAEHRANMERKNAMEQCRSTIVA